MKQDRVSDVLKSVGIFRSVCDLDLLLFFIDHPRAFLTSEWLATYLGYDLARVADSIEVLLSAKLLVRPQTSKHAARLYVLNIDAIKDERLALLLNLASTVQGRLELRKTLLRRLRAEAHSAPVTWKDTSTVANSLRPLTTIRPQERRRAVRRSGSRGDR